MRTPLLAVVGMLLAGSAQLQAAGAQSVGAPKVSENDTWTYQNTAENRTGWHQVRNEITVTRAGSSSIALSTKPVGSTMPPTEMLVGADWSRSRSVNGHQTTVNRPLAFPLTVGKSWDVEYAEDHPNREHSSEHRRSAYKVIGWEDVTVPAGTFHALKIEADGDWSAAIAPAVSGASASRVDAQGATSIIQTNRAIPSTVSGRTYKAFWYAPEVKRWVKSIEEYYGADNVRNERYEDDLEAYKVTN